MEVVYPLIIIMCGSDVCLVGQMTGRTNDWKEAFSQTLYAVLIDHNYCPVDVSSSSHFLPLDTEYCGQPYMGICQRLRVWCIIPEC